MSQIRSIHDLRTIIDVGSGLWFDYNNLLNMNKHVKIYAFEPCPDLFLKLNEMRSKWIKHDHTINDRFMLYDTAVYNLSKPDVKFNIFNDSVASSISSLSATGAQKWDYPFNRARFKIVKTIPIHTITLTDFISHNKHYITTIDLLNIDIQGDCYKVLQGMTSDIYKKIKRIIIKVIDIPYMLYKPQTDMIQIFDTLRAHNFTLIRGVDISKNQEKRLEFANKLYIQPNDNHSSILSIYKG